MKKRTLCVVSIILLTTIVLNTFTPLMALAGGHPTYQLIFNLSRDRGKREIHLLDAWAILNPQEALNGGHDRGKHYQPPENDFKILLEQGQLFLLMTWYKKLCWGDQDIREVMGLVFSRGAQSLLAPPEQCLYEGGKSFVIGDCELVWLDPSDAQRVIQLASEMRADPKKWTINEEDLAKEATIRVAEEVRAPKATPEPKPDPA